jgi:hypothetical protein
VVRQLKAHGFDAAALLGGYAAWSAAYPVEPKTGVVAAAGTPGDLSVESNN